MVMTGTLRLIKISLMGINETEFSGAGATLDGGGRGVTVDEGFGIANVEVAESGTLVI